MEMEPRQFLPDDLIVDEIVARGCSPATIVRCAAVSKPLRRRILRPAFLTRRLPALGLPRSDGGGAADLFVPSLLLGVYHRARDDPCSPLAFVPAAGAASIAASSLDLVPPPAAATPVSDDHAGGGGGGVCVFGSYQPLSSRRSLVVLRRRCKIVSHQGRRHRHNGAARNGGELTVCNPASGERWVLPPHEVFDQTLVLVDVNHHDGGVGGSLSSSFKLLAAHLPESSPRSLTVQVFSSDERQWGPPLACAISRPCDLIDPAKPVVLRGAVHWLCRTRSCYRILKYRHRRRGGEHHQPPNTSLMKLPLPCESGVHDMCLALSPSSHASSSSSSSSPSLSVVVLQQDHIAVWVRSAAAATSSSGGSWEQRHVIREDGVAGARPPMDLPWRDGWVRRITGLEWFCEGSGALFLEHRDDDAPFLVLDLHGRGEVRIANALQVVSSRQLEFCPYEVDLISYMTFFMKRF
uniref:DUF7595 domain-containing protein n=1 Tax=Oryza brachyantha TaxID=4533 RepID=J3LQT8_ORYBR